jgi:alpha-mannosidase
MNNTSRSFIFSILIFIISPVILCQEPSKPEVNDTTYMLTYDHGGLILWGSDHFRERLHNAVDWLNKYPYFKIGLDNEAQIYDFFAENEPQLLKEIKDLLIKYKGRFGIGSCTYGQPLSEFINDESNIRQISYALEAERKYFNDRPPVYLMSEHAMHSQIPQILNGFGFKGAIMRTHFMMYGYNPTFDVPVGWWVGIDGSKIETIPTYVGEGAEFAKTPIDNWILTRYPGDDSKEPMESYRTKFAHIKPLLASRADDSGLRKEELVKEYESKPMFQWILLDKLLSKYPIPTTDMVTKPNDFVVRMPWGYCGNKIWNESRKAEISILTAERLAAIEMLNGGQPHEKELESSWKNLLLAQHHDIQICGLLPDADKLLSASFIKSEQSINQSMEFFSGNMKGEGLRQVTVFNPLSWNQTRWITAYVSLQKGSVKSFVVKCGDKLIPARIIESDRFSDGSILDAHIAFKAELDPLSITTFSVLSADRTNEEDTLIRAYEKKLEFITPFYEVKLSEEGGIASIKDIRTGDLITDGDQRASYLEGKINGLDCKSSGKWTIIKSSETTPWIKVVEHGFISDIPFELEMTFYEDNPRIDCKVNVEFNGQKIGLLSDNQRDGYSPFVHEDKLRFKFFPKIDTGAIGIRDLPFTIAETKDKYVNGNYWTALSDGSSGIAFFNKGNMGSVREKDKSFSIPLAYSMYYVWGTRILYGQYTYEFAILPFKGNWKEADLHRKTLEYSFPIPSFEGIPGKGIPENNMKTFSILCDNDVILTGLFPHNGTITARFCKLNDQNAISSLRFEKQGAEIVESNLDGKFLRTINGKIDFKPWQIKTFQIYLHK